MLLTLLLTPIYITNLGFEAYGLIGFFLLTQSIMMILEFGMPLALNRTIARLRANPNNSLSISKTFKSFEYIFFLLPLFLILIIGVPFSIYSNQIINNSELSELTVKMTVFLIFAQVCSRFPLIIYQAALTGFERIIILNKLMILFGIVRLGGSALLLVIFDFGIIGFFSYQLALVFVEVFVLRKVSWNHKDLKTDISSHIGYAFKESKFILTSFLVSILGVLLSQFDKVVLTSKLSLESFGEYSLMALFGSAIIVLGYPIGSVSFPAFSKAMAVGDNKELIEIVNSYLRIASIIIIPISCFLIFFIEESIIFYLKDGVSSQLLNIFPIYLMGSMFASFVPLFNGLILSSNNSRDTFWILLSLSIFYIPALIFLINSFGLTGAAYGFLLIQLGIFLGYFIRCNFIFGFKEFFPRMLLSFILPGIFTFFCFYLLDQYLSEKIEQEKNLGLLILLLTYIFMQSLVFIIWGKETIQGLLK